MSYFFLQCFLANNKYFPYVKREIAEKKNIFLRLNILFVFKNLFASKDILAKFIH